MSDRKSDSTSPTPLRGMTSVREALTAQRAINLDRLLQTIGGILLAICSAITWKTLNRVDEHEVRIVRQETLMQGQAELLKEIREDLKDIKKSLAERMIK